MMEQYVIGLDQGTTGTTALLFDANQKLIARAYKEHRQSFPKPGWVEHNPEEIFDNVLLVIRELIAQAKIEPTQIRGIGITNQRETSVVWDRHDSKSVYPAIVWQCRRTATECERLKKNKPVSKKIQKITGLTIDPYFSATKVAWILKQAHLPTKNLAAGTIDTWLIWKFTKGMQHVTDVTNASRTMLFDIQKQKWSEALCKRFQIPMEILPNVQPSISDFGVIHKDYFGHEIPILGVLGDQQASLFGHGATKPFQAKCTFGTGAFALVHCGNKPLYSKHKLLTTAACSHNKKAQYALEGSVFMAGSIIQWLRDELKIIEEAAQMDGLAQSISSNEGIYLVPAFAGLGAPHWNPNVRGIITGMHLGTSRAHIARASLEAIAYQVYDLFDAIKKDIRKKITTLHVDGGVTNSNFLMQFLTDILQIPVHRSAMVEMTAYGAAKAAAISLNLWNVLDDKSTSIFYPKQSASDVKPLIAGWKKAVEQALMV